MLLVNAFFDHRYHSRKKTFGYTCKAHSILSNKINGLDPVKLKLKWLGKASK